MKSVWDRRRALPRASKSQGSGPELTISEAHSSRMVLRTIELPKDDKQLVEDTPGTPEPQDVQLSDSEDQSDEEMDYAHGVYFRLYITAGY
ncbi:hypothetical protein RhiJN_13220 [Ceratobasidium sp. AG-Ba]|nr:hypothetical protein RhiJN_13220 [Ceratobasidium sp. AG-Ba]